MNRPNNPPSFPRHLLIVGASARAAAQSAHRAGLSVTAVDLFADSDLAAIARTCQLAAHDYPHAALPIARKLKECMCMYTGGLENYPLVVGEIGRAARLLGNDQGALTAVRDPVRLATVLQAAHWNTLQVYERIVDLPSEGEWICKPRRSCGGNRVRRLSAARHEADDVVEEGCYFQQWMPGRSYAASYLATSDGCYLLGVTRQWHRRDLFDRRAADRFGDEAWQYLGSCGPLSMDAATCQQWWQLGTIIADGFDLQGLFGIDAIVSEPGVLEHQEDRESHLGPGIEPEGGQPRMGEQRIWLVEVNPRYTASMELWERTTGVSCVRNHVNACLGFTLDDQLQRGPIPADHQLQIWGKVIFFAPSAGVVSARFLEEVLSRGGVVTGGDGGAWPMVCDIPSVGTEVRSGWPVCTLFAAGTTP
ncbi:MAG: ATP-grasp domain-containing protein, partial [Planctomycetales bacterium]|nr:ATP-grasp domain-containing protein [Planctomycetales bacterium]